MPINAKNKRWAFLIVMSLLLGWGIVGWAHSSIPLTNDFIEYWSAGKLLLLGNDPYSAGQVLDMERGLGRSGAGPLIPFSPPWALTFMAPLALVNPHLSRVLWLFTTIALVGACTEWSWRLYDGGNSVGPLKWLVAILFAPTLTVLIIGQAGPLILAALISFLLLERERHDFLAGMLVMPAAIKPQLLYLFWIGLLVWACKYRRWAVPAGLGVALIISSALALAFDPAIFSQYFSLLRDPMLLDQPYPVLGGVLRLLFGVEKRWLQFVPAAFGLAWFVQYWRTCHRDWGWREHLPLLLLVSLVTTPYGWFFDQVVLLPVVMQCTIWVVRRRGAVAAWAAVAFVATNLIALAFIAVGLTTFWYVWIAPVWLLFYLVLRHYVSKPPVPASSSECC